MVEGSHRWSVSSEKQRTVYDEFGKEGLKDVQSDRDEEAFLADFMASDIFQDWQ